MENYEQTRGYKALMYAHLSQMENLTNEYMASLGDTCEDCQKLCMIGALNEVDMVINGVTDEDMIVYQDARESFLAKDMELEETLSLPTIALCVRIYIEDGGHTWHIASNGMEPYYVYEFLKDAIEDFTNKSRDKALYNLSADELEEEADWWEPEVEE